MPPASEPSNDEVRVPLLLVEGVEVADSQPAPCREAHEEGQEGDKYPPLPPSYNDVMRADLNTRSRWQVAKEHLSALPQYVPEGVRLSVGEMWSRTKGGVVRLWPQSRLAHVFLVLTGLWLLFVFTEPVLSQPEAEGGFWSWEDIEPYETLPQPFPGDGHIRQSANWTMKGCAMEKVMNSFASSLYCTATTSFELDVPPSFGAGDHLYVLVDSPSETPASSDDKRGNARGIIRVVEDPQDHGAPEDLHAKVKVLVQAKYDKMKERYFRGANVVQLGSNAYHQGVGVYTRPVPGKHAIEWDVTILVPQHVPIPMLDIKTSAMHVALYDGVGPSVPTAANSSTTAPTPRQGEVAKPRKATKRGLTPRHFDPIHMDSTTLSHFGALTVQTLTGTIAIGWDLGRALETAGVLSLRTHSGDLLVGGNVHANMMELRTGSGNVRVGPKMGLEAWREASIRTQAGDIELNPGAFIRATSLKVTSEAGSIVSLAAAAAANEKLPGTLYANHTLSLDLGAGNVGPVPIALQKPQLFGFRPTEPFDYVVHVNTRTKAGTVDLTLSQEEEIPQTIEATSQAGSVNVALDTYFVGNVEVLGRKGTKVSPPTKGSTWTPKKSSAGGQVKIVGTLDRMGASEVVQQSYVKLNATAGRSTLALGR